MVTLLWEGGPSLDAARRAMEGGERIEITLPQGVHHALFRHLHPDAPRGAPEIIDEDDGAHMLLRIATVAGLEELSQLARGVQQSRYRVHLASPDPLLVLTPKAPRELADA